MSMLCFFFKQKTAYEMRISDWSSDVCSSDLFSDFFAPKLPAAKKTRNAGNGATSFHQDYITFAVDRTGGMTFWLALEDYGPEFGTMRSEEHTSELQSLMRISYAVFCLKKKKHIRTLNVQTPLTYHKQS